MIKWLVKVILILMVLTGFSNFVTTWFNHPEVSVLHPQEFARAYGDSLFANPLFWIVTGLIFVWFAIKLFKKQGDS